MENKRNFGGRIGVLWLFVGMCLLFHCIKVEGIVNPLNNVNLSPFAAWISVYQCMQNVSSTCLAKDVLTLQGLVNVNQTEVSEYCKAGGCYEHTIAVLNCIHLVKRDMKFANKATVNYLKNLITNGCSNSKGFTSENYTSSGNAIKMDKWLLSMLITMLGFITILWV